MKRISYVLLAFCLMLGVICHLPKISANDQVNVMAKFKAPFSYQESGLLEILFESASPIDVSSITVDASLLGEPKVLNVSPELNKITVTVTKETPIGQYELPVTVKDKEQNSYETVAIAEIIEPSDPNKRAWDEEVIYFMLTDRFNDGDSSNNNPYDLPYEEAQNQGGIYHGGDFKGIIEKLDYLSDLGVSMIWITPIVENIKHNVGGTENGEFYGYHGYWAADFEALNPHLGTLEEFHQLIDQAAEHDISIMVDVVLNHAGYGLEGDLNLEDAHYPTQEDQDRFEGMFRTDENRKHGDAVLDSLSGLPDFVTEDPVVRQQLVEWQTNWVKRSETPSGNRIRAFRVDTVKHVDDTTWQHLKNELVEIAPDFRLIGEVWDAQYNRVNRQLGDGMMDSLLDFGFKSYAAGFANGFFDNHQKNLEARSQQLTTSRTMGQFLGSHDEDGFLVTLAKNDSGRLMLAATLQLTSKGQPVIYYGEELGYSGLNNWPIYDNRYVIDWTKAQDNLVLAHYQKLLNFRENFRTLLTKGTTHYVAGSKEEEWFLTETRLNDQIVYIGYNPTEEARTIRLKLDNEEATVFNHYDESSYELDASLDEEHINLIIPPRQSGGTVLIEIINGQLETADVP